MLESLVIPTPPQPLSFERLKELNPGALPEELRDAFMGLPAEMREQAWLDLRLRVALLEWNAVAHEESPA